MKSPNEEYPPCASRQQLTAFRKDGTKERIQRCAEHTAELFQKDVSPTDCESCPVRKSVTMKAMEAKSYQPPLADKIYSVATKKPDTKAPTPWKPCKDRQLATIDGCCGAGKVEIRICNSADCFRLGSAVSPEICMTCPLRNP